MNKIIITYRVANEVLTETIEGEDLQEEQQLFDYCSRHSDISFNDWWKQGEFSGADIMHMEVETHGIVGWTEKVLNDSECPMWLYRSGNQFMVTVTVE